MTPEEKTALDHLIGTTVAYQNKEYIIESYKTISSGYIIIRTNKRTFNFLPNELKGFLESLKKVSEPKEIWTPAKVEPKTEIVVQLPAENKPLKNTLLEVLKEIKENPTPGNLKKAESICNVSNTLINIQKTEIQLLRMQKKLTK